MMPSCCNLQKSFCYIFNCIVFRIRESEERSVMSYIFLFLVTPQHPAASLAPGKFEVQFLFYCQQKEVVKSNYS